MTIPAPHQLRVLNEEAELAERVDKLYAFMVSERFDAVPDDEQDRMEKQHEAMKVYRDVLRERIANF